VDAGPHNDGRNFDRTPDDHGLSVRRGAAHRLGSDARTELDGLAMRKLGLLKLLKKKGSADELRAKAQAADKQGQWPQATALWRKLAAGGDAKACYILGERYEAGQGVVQNFTEAAHWF